MSTWCGSLRAVLLVSASVAAAGLSACYNPFEDKFVSACETTLKKRLRSPSTYTRIKVSSYEATVPLDEYFRVSKSDAAEIDFRKRTGGTPKKYSSFIEYDAANAYGTPVRNIAECSYYSFGERNNASEYGVMIDGKTNTDWLVEQMNRQ